MPGNRNEALGKPGASVLSVPARDAIGKAGVPVWGFDFVSLNLFCGLSNQAMAGSGNQRGAERSLPTRRP